MQFSVSYKRSGHPSFFSEMLPSVCSEFVWSLEADRWPVLKVFYLGFQSESSLALLIM